MRNPGTADVLRFVLPGLDRFCSRLAGAANGTFLRGIVWLLVTPGP